MIVVDASAILEMLLGTPSGIGIRDRILDPAEILGAPHLIDLEVTQVLRRYVLLGALTASRATESIEDLLDLPIERYAHTVLVQRAWQLRDNLSAYDAAYVALAEILEAPLLTCDARLAGAAGHRARIELVQPSAS